MLLRQCDNKPQNDSVYIAYEELWMFSKPYNVT